MTSLLTSQQARGVVLPFPARGVYCPPELTKWPRKPAPLWAVILAAVASLPVVWLAVDFAVTQLARFQ